MGCYRGCCRPTPVPTPVCDGFAKVLLFLLVIFILLCIPKLCTYEPPPPPPPPKEPINWARIVVPLLLLAIVLWLSSMGCPDPDCKPCPSPPPRPPPCKRYHRCSCKRCVPWGVAH
ncbi:hypothetical protein ACB098_07G138400 [Castanea mollissima]|uniref:Uncharacterized protein n=1 Tax=Castanea mollissima TaxID=60419 RepID=A0A8J4R463_9ROSI|nr:hypothetical protein CMV_018743 [Castanea mollissima]